MMSFTHKTGKILFGILIIAVAVFLLLESFGVISASGILSIPFWKLGLSLLLLTCSTPWLVGPTANVTVPVSVVSGSLDRVSRGAARSETGVCSFWPQSGGRRRLHSPASVTLVTGLFRSYVSSWVCLGRLFQGIWTWPFFKSPDRAFY